jgi:hypothetical protein
MALLAASFDVFLQEGTGTIELVVRRKERRHTYASTQLSCTSTKRINSFGCRADEYYENSCKKQRGVAPNHFSGSYGAPVFVPFKDLTTWFIYINSFLYSVELNSFLHPLVYLLSPCLLTLFHTLIYS